MSAQISKESSLSTSNLPARWCSNTERAMAVAVFRKMHKDFYPSYSALERSCEAILLLEANKASNSPQLFKEAMGAERKNLSIQVHALRSELESTHHQILGEKITSLDGIGIEARVNAIIGLQHQLNNIITLWGIVADSRHINADVMNAYVKKIEGSLARFRLIFDNINSFTPEKIEKKVYIGNTSYYEVDPTAKS